MARVQFLAGTRDFSLLHIIHTAAGEYPASYPVGTGGCLPRVKATMVWSWPLTSIWCWGQEWWSYAFTPAYVFMVGCLINWTQEQLYLLPLPQKNKHCWNVHVAWLIGSMYSFKISGLDGLKSASSFYKGSWPGWLSLFMCSIVKITNNWSQDIQTA
jgi:hypothetical protein